MISLFTSSPFQLLIDNNNFNLDYDITITHGIDNIKSANIVLYNTNLNNIGLAEVKIAGFTYFKAKLDSALDIELNHADVSRELTINLYEDLYFDLPSTVSANSKLENVKGLKDIKQFFTKTTNVLSKVLEFVKVQKGSGVFIHSDSIWIFTVDYIQNMANIIGKKELKTSNDIKVIRLTENYNKEVLHLKVVPSSIIKVGDCFVYNKKEYIVANYSLGISTFNGIDMALECKTTNWIAKESSNGYLF